MMTKNSRKNNTNNTERPAILEASSFKELFTLTRIFGSKCFPGKKVPTGRNFERYECARPFDCPQTKPVGVIPFDCTSHSSFLPVEVRKGSKCCFLHKHLRWRFQQLAAGNASCEHPWTRCPAGLPGNDAPPHNSGLSSLSCHQNITLPPHKLPAANTWTPRRMWEGGKQRQQPTVDLIGQVVRRKVEPLWQNR